MAYQPYNSGTPPVQQSQAGSLLSILKGLNAKQAPAAATTNQMAALKAGQGPVNAATADQFAMDNLRTSGVSTPQIGGGANQTLNQLANANSPANKSSMSY